MKRVVALMGGTGFGTVEAGGGAANFKKISMLTMALGITIMEEAVHSSSRRQGRQKRS